VDQREHNNGTVYESHKEKKRNEKNDILVEEPVIRIKHVQELKSENFDGCECKCVSVYLAVGGFVRNTKRNTKYKQIDRLGHIRGE
jgi:hypothetical protein